MTEKICYTIERHVSGISLAGTIKYAPVAQLDRALDSDISDVSSCDMAQNLAVPAFAGTAEKKCVVVDYYLTTIAEIHNPICARSSVG